MAGRENLDWDDLRYFLGGLASVPAARWIEERAAAATSVLRCREMTEMAQAARSGAGIAALACSVGDLEPGLRRLTPRVIATRPIRFVTEVVRDNARVLRGG